MITLNTGAKFAANNKEIINTLFTGNSTPDGTYKKLKGGIKLFNLQGELFAFIVDKDNEQFFVSARTVKHNGRNRTRYQFALSSLDEKYLGLSDYGYMAEIECAKHAIKQVK